MRRIDVLWTVSRAGLTLALSGFLTGCGLGPSPIPEGQTRITFHSGRAPTSLSLMESFIEAPTREAPTSQSPSAIGSSSQMGGGILIYLLGINGTPFATNFHLADEFASASFFVPNGSYRVGAFGWSAGDFGGTARCGFGNGGGDIALKGGTQDIQINLSAANCGSTEALSPAAHLSSSQFLPLKFTSCRDFTNVSAGNSTCTTGLIQSVRIVLPIFKLGDGTLSLINETPPSISTCQTLSSGSVATSAMIPVGGNANALLPVVVLAYSGSSCGATNLIGSYTFSSLLNADKVVYRSGASKEIVSSSGGARIFSYGSRTVLYLVDF